MKAFQINGHDYRLGKELDLKKVAAFFSKKFTVNKLWNGSRHVLGILDDKYFLKLSTTKGISLLTEFEYKWNEEFNQQVNRSVSEFWVPKNMESGYLGDLFYLITDRHEGKEADDIDKIIEFTKLIQTLKLSFTQDVSFFDKTKLWYDDIPEDIAEKYQIYKLLNIVEKDDLEIKPRHGDFAPWHIMEINDGKFLLIDGEHARADGVEMYDIAYFIQRVYSVSKNPQLAIKISEKLGDLDKLKIVLAARAIGGFLDESLTPDPDYKYAESFQKFILSLRA